MSRPEHVRQVGGLQVVRWRDAALPPGLDALVDEAARAGHAWIRPFPDEWKARPYLDDGEALVLAMDDAEPVAMAAVAAHARDAATGRLKYIYVGPGARGRGLLRVLVEFCLARADSRWQRLTLHTDNPRAARVYASYGFRPTTEHGHSTHVREIGYSAASRVAATP